MERTPEQEQQHIKRQRIAVVVWAGLLLVILSFVIQEISRLKLQKRTAGGLPDLATCRSALLRRWLRQGTIFSSRLTTISFEANR